MQPPRFFSTRRGTLVALAVLAGLAVLAAYLEPAAAPLSGTARASDGDSFRLGSNRVRLLGIDAPELRQTCEDASGRPWPCGAAARSRMADLLAAGALQCRPEQTDKFGRLLAYCTIGERDIGATLVSEGLAIASGAYWREEQAARTARLGVWVGGFDSPRQWRQDHTGTVQGWNWLAALGL